MAQGVACIAPKVVVAVRITVAAWFAVVARFLLPLAHSARYVARRRTNSHFRRRDTHVTHHRSRSGHVSGSGAGAGQPGRQRRRAVHRGPDRREPLPGGPGQRAVHADRSQPGHPGGAARSGPRQHRGALSELLSGRAAPGVLVRRQSGRERDRHAGRYEVPHGDVHRGRPLRLGEQSRGRRRRLGRGRAAGDRARAHAVRDGVHDPLHRLRHGGTGPDRQRLLRGHAPRRRHPRNDRAGHDRLLGRLPGGAHLWPQQLRTAQEPAQGGPGRIRQRAFDHDPRFAGRQRPRPLRVGRLQGLPADRGPLRLQPVLPPLV
jgi:hypothetical protein